MSTIDRIRDAIEGSNELLVRIPRRQAEALCDLADAARRLLDAETDPDLRTAESDLEMALKGLDGEEET